MTNRHVFDCIGVGFGPSNIALAIALEEKGLLHNSLFLEKHDQVQWHPGMLIEGADIQHNPLRDFVTPRNPRSPYGFLSYLKEQGRLFDYLNLSAPFPPRTEYAGYVSWVARQFAEQVLLGAEVTDMKMSPGQDGRRLLQVRTANGNAYTARAVVFGCGRSRHVPPEFEDLLCNDVIHSDDYLRAKKRWLERGRPINRIAVVGGSQSAAEILLDLSARCEVVGITRSFGFKQKDLSPFTECIYYPEFVDYFFGSDIRSQSRITHELWRSNYGAADHDVIDSLNFKLYEQRVTGQGNISIHQNASIERIEALPCEGGYRIAIADRYNGTSSAVPVDGIIFATGYRNFGNRANQETHHPLFEGIVDNVVFRDDGGPDVLRDYRLNTTALDASVFLNGLCESSHGFGDAGSFSILSIRGDAIASSLERILRTDLPRTHHQPDGHPGTATHTGVAIDA